jgi:hypothetical protein
MFYWSFGEDVRDFRNKFLEDFVSRFVVRIIIEYVCCADPVKGKAILVTGHEGP